MQTEKNMAGPYEIIVLDLDGTLTNRDKVVTPRTKAALMKAQERGKKVVLASGRPTQGVMPLAKELRLTESTVVYSLLQRRTDHQLQDRAPCLRISAGFCQQEDH